jgi:hypothetical protein
MVAVKWKSKCAEDEEGSKQETARSGNFSILGVQIQQQVFFSKRHLIATLHSKKTTLNGLGRIDCSVLRISSG